MSEEASGAFQGAASGAAAGSVFGPAGAIIGGTLGAVGGAFGGKAKRKAKRAAKKAQKLQRELTALNNARTLRQVTRQGANAVGGLGQADASSGVSASSRSQMAHASVVTQVGETAKHIEDSTDLGNRIEDQLAKAGEYGSRGQAVEGFMNTAFNFGLSNMGGRGQGDTGIGGGGGAAPGGAAGTTGASAGINTGAIGGIL